MRLALITSADGDPRAAECTWRTDAASRATLGDLRRAAGRPAGGAIAVDGTRHPPDTPLTSLPLARGSTIDLTGATPHLPVGSGAALVITGGIGAGTAHLLPLSPAAVGRAPHCDLCLPDPTVARTQATFAHDGDSVRLTPAACATNPTRVDGHDLGAGAPTPLPVGDDQPRTIAFGAVRAQVWDDDRDPPTRLPSPPDRDGRVPWHRPPRNLGAPPLPPVQVPPPIEVPAAVPFSWIGTLTPLVVGLGLAIAVHPTMAVFALLGPVYAAGTWIENRRRTRSQERRGARAERAAVDRAIKECGARHRIELQQLRAALPGPAELVRWSRNASPRLWERRPGHPDFLRLRVGLADVPFLVPGLREAALSAPARTALEGALARLGPLADVPVPVEAGASDAGMIGLCGPRGAALAVARALVLQAAALHGPADLGIALAGHEDDHPAAEWAWLSWLPHGRSDDRPCFVVVDSPHHPPVAERAVGIAIGRTADDLPSACGVIVHLTDELGSASVEWLDGSRPTARVLADGVPLRIAADAARRLARWSDPADPVSGAGLPARISLLDLLDLDPSPAALAGHVTDTWSASPAGRSLRATIGRAATGPTTLDLVADGPHGLIAGTTGAGKSELLRTLVASVAMAHRPDDVSFLLVDYKGGSAFDACRDLPHVVGVITDLDGHLASRALTALDAETRRREALLRACHADDLIAYRELAPATAEPLPRLVVVIDEFATLARELPDFLTTLVSIGQRGRSLGIHLLLATQRPSGVVNDQIRTNTNLRLALRLLDAGDAIDVVGSAAPVGLPRDQPGRAVARRDAHDAELFQTALVTAAVESSTLTAGAVTVAFAGEAAAPPALERPPDGAPSVLDRIVAACVAAAASLGIAPPRRPWLDPLPADVSLADLATVDADATRRATAPVGLVDDPSHQRRCTWSWRLDDGPLLVFGMPGSGTTSSLRTIAAALVTIAPAASLELHVADLCGGGLDDLASLPCTGNVISAHETGRLAKLIDRLDDQLDRRRRVSSGTAPPLPRTVVLVDGMGALLDSFDGLEGMRRLDRFERVWREGHQLGIHLAATADRSSTVPSAFAAATGQRLVLQLADRYDLVAIGLPTAATGIALPAVAGRGLTIDGLEVQIAHVTPRHIRDLAPTLPVPDHAPHRIDDLPSLVRAESLGPARLGDPWRIPVGLRDDTLAAAHLELHRGDHALVSGPARSGVSSTLASIAMALRAAGIDVHAVAPRPSPLRDACPDARPRLEPDLLASLANASGPVRPVAIVIDEADRVADLGGGDLAALIDGAAPAVCVIAGGRADRLRAAYGHWSAAIRSSRCGVALLPDPDLDGDLWGARFPRPGLAAPAGRGYLVVDGQPVLIHAARPTGAARRAA